MTAPASQGNPTPAHRPLSDWIARVRTGAPGRLPGLGHINDGSERTDARTMPRFCDQAWTRISVVVERAGEPCRALALRAPDGTTVVELDDFGVPVHVSEAGAGLVARLETGWGTPPADPATVAGLRDESLPLRYFLLHRLARETHTPPQLFHCLPWERVEAAAHSATPLLHAEGAVAAEPPPAPDGELRHWFTPAASPLAGPLQVLEAGLRTGRSGPWFGREAANLLSGLLAVETARLPGTTRHALADLTDALAAADPALHHCAQLAATRLRGTVPITPITLSRRLDSDFVLRASSGERAVGRSEFIEQGPFATGLTVTVGGLLEIEMEIEDHPIPPARRLDDGPLFHPVTVRPATDTDTGTDSTGWGGRYWMALSTSAGALHGFLAVPAPGATFKVDLDAPPMPLRFLDRVSRAELEASFRANEHVTLSQWHRMIDGLPLHHPAHASLAAYVSGRT